MQKKKGATYERNVYFIIYLNVNMMFIVYYDSIFNILEYFRIYIFNIPKICHYFIANYKNIFLF